jgi:hypothetical protein
MIQIQLTLYTDHGKYRPMSTIVEVESIEYYKTHKKEVQEKAVRKISVQRRMDIWAMKQNGYNRIKARVYDKAKIEQEKKERYEQIKKERGWE